MGELMTQITLAGTAVPPRGLLAHRGDRLDGHPRDRPADARRVTWRTGCAYVSGSSFAVLAREKAREAVESVHTARDTGLADVGARFRTKRRRRRVQGRIHRSHDARAPTAWSTPTTTTEAIEELRTPGPDGTSRKRRRRPSAARRTSSGRSRSPICCATGRRRSTRTSVRLRSPSNTPCRGSSARTPSRRTCRLIHNENLQSTHSHARTARRATASPR